jgi:hypothetical protein
VIEEPEDCLGLLVQLQRWAIASASSGPRAKSSECRASWGYLNFKFNIRQKQDWFAASGEIQISDTQVMDLQQLMALLDKSSGNFVELSDGQFLA